MSTKKETQKSNDEFFELLAKEVEIKYPLKYELTTYSQLKYIDFRYKHAKCKGYFSLIFTPGPIGTCIKARCHGCSTECDITDYGSW